MSRRAAVVGAVRSAGPLAWLVVVHAAAGWCVGFVAGGVWGAVLADAARAEGLPVSDLTVLAPVEVLAPAGLRVGMLAGTLRWAAGLSPGGGRGHGGPLGRPGGGAAGG